MKVPDSLTLFELQSLLQVVEESLAITSHLELFHWLQKRMRHFLPHDVVIAAWGDFSLGLVRYDLVSDLPGFRTDTLEEGLLQPFLTDLFARWNKERHMPCSMVSSQVLVNHPRLQQEWLSKLQQMPVTLMHGIKDQRGRHDCLYIFLGSDELVEQRPRQLLRYLLPYLDTAFRQVAHLPEQYFPSTSSLAAFRAERATPDEESGPTDEFGLSSREHDIMEWVRAGKTNQEIGMILDISAFTVKNHIQRIFKKLNVVNRAQAVSKMSQGRGAK